MRLWVIVYDLKNLPVYASVETDENGAQTERLSYYPPENSAGSTGSTGSTSGARDTIGETVSSIEYEGMSFPNPIEQYLGANLR